MIKKIEHIGIAVKNIETANEIYSKLLGVAPYKSEEVESEMVITSFFKTGENKIELLEAKSAESAISKFIEKKGEGIHHIA
ncbi:MAG TPA: VOC family protein, partial [Bacteroidia bacterium]|nr:VOC family protein [Bacteroidia bacterium]